MFKEDEEEREKCRLWLGTMPTNQKALEGWISEDLYYETKLLLWNTCIVSWKNLKSSK